MYNIICFSSFVIMFGLSFLLEKCRKKDLILRLISIAVLIYKIIYYINQNIKGNVVVPVEISSITYFLMCIILLFKITPLYSVGSFYGIMAGLGYFLFYTFFGYKMTSSFPLKDVLAGCFNHGFVLVSGIHLFKTNEFEEKDKQRIWITIFAMLCWALVFYDIEMRGITFVYYIIKPKFLFIFEYMPLNVIILLLYYAILILAFYLVLNLFFKINHKYKNEYSIKKVQLEK